MAAESLIMKFEAGSSPPPLVAYRDSGGVWTIGYGSTFNYLKNRPVMQGDVITESDAIDFLKKDINDVKVFLLKVVRRKLSSNEFDALVSFVYNVGKNNFLRSKMLRLLNTGVDKKIVANEFDRWVFDNGRVVPGLVTRREREKKIFLGI